MYNKKNEIPLQKQQSLPNFNLKQNQEEEIDLQKLITYSRKSNNTLFLKEYYLTQEKAYYFIIRIKLRGKDEQKLFETNPDLIFVLRRGLTILNLNNSYTILRKGLPKFYDLGDFWRENAQNENQFLYKNQLHQAYQSLKLSIPVTIVQQQQENGENFQISFSSILQTWIISSKNVSIFCRNYEDYLLNCPNKDIDCPERLPWQIAKIWFSDMIDRNGEQLQQDLTDFTLLGEFVHNPFFIHIIEYQQPALIFFALINNHQRNFCCHTIQAEHLANKHNLHFVKTKYMQANKQIILDNHLSRIYDNIKQSPMSISGEGVVIYLFNEFECLSISKIKTIEYEQHKLFRTKLTTLIQYYQETQLSYADVYQQEANDLNQYDDREITRFIELNTHILLSLQYYLINIKQKDIIYQEQIYKFCSKYYMQFYTQIVELTKSHNVKNYELDNIFKYFDQLENIQAYQNQDQQKKNEIQIEKNLNELMQN
ncbi:unnamed protein product [Paramecium sonneborni]|uniref:Uncharacterized protein n=1 Tax=Paramecium sonneborni TaxID=65129 RepID=A0A8S1MIH5_9CILI|nr:unnamed protein product [Paramecium sonneborni]